MNRSEATNLLLLLLACTLKMGSSFDDLTMTVYAAVDNVFKLYADGDLIIDKYICWEIYTETVPRSLSVFAIDGHDDGAGGWSILSWTDTGLYTDASWKCIDYEQRAKYGVDGDNWVKKDFNDDAWPYAGVKGPIGWRSCNMKVGKMKYAPPDALYIWAESKLYGSQGGSKSRVLCRKNYNDKCYNLKPCKNGGTCSNSKNMADYSCKCPVGFVGKDCDVNFDECSSNPCHHGGSCRDNINSYTCDCKKGYRGSSCEIDIDECASKPCKNGATCTDGINNVMCSCESGYDGRLCNNEVNECNSSPCQHGSTCDDLVGRYACKCHRYWTGIVCESCLKEYTAEQCELSLGACKSSPCLNLGTCRNTKDGFTCLCEPDYTGSNCKTEITECRQNPCRNGASCEDTMQDGLLRFKCYCPPEFTGRFCELENAVCKSSPCFHGGTCAIAAPGYTCICDDGYSGQRCETDYFRHSGELTENMIECVEKTPGRFLCTCAPGFTGVDCQSNLDNCDHVSCPNNTHCVDAGSNGYECKCLAGYQPDDCVVPCTSGTFGQDCAEECHCLGDAACDHVTGECPSGCQEGYRGFSCNLLIEAASAVHTGNDKIDMTTMIIGGAVGGVALVALIVGAVVLRKRKKNKPDDKLHLADRRRNEGSSSESSSSSDSSGESTSMSEV